MLNSPYVAELIQKGEIDKIKEAMEQSADRGMQTFDQSLYNLYKAGKISLEEALHNADSRNNLSVRVRLAEGGKAAEPGAFSVNEESHRKSNN